MDDPKLSGVFNSNAHSSLKGNRGCSWLWLCLCVTSFQTEGVGSTWARSILLIKGVPIKKNPTTQLHLRHLLRPSNIISTHILLAKVNQSYTFTPGNGEQKNVSLIGRLCKPGIKKRVYNVLIREEQIDVIKTTIYLMAFFPQSCKMAAGSSHFVPVWAERNRKGEKSAKLSPGTPEQLDFRLMVKIRSHEHSCLEGG